MDTNEHEFGGRSGHDLGLEVGRRASAAAESHKRPSRFDKLKAPSSPRRDGSLHLSVNAAERFF